MEPSTHWGICSLCEAGCGVGITVEDGQVMGIKGDPDDALSRGYVCPKVMGLVDIQEDPDRIRHPLRRDGATWTRCGWDEALDDIATRIYALQEAHGQSAVGVYLGNPNVHNLGMMLYGPHLLRTLRSRHRFSATSVDQLPHMLVAWWMFGHQLLLPIPDLDRTELLVVLGANPAVSNGSLMTAPGMPGRLKALRRRGGRVVVVDPRRTETAALADEHHFLRPETDALWLLAVVHVVLEARGARLGHLATHVDGLEALRTASAEFTPERVAAATGVPADVTRRLAHALADTERAVLYGRIGTCTQSFGGLAAWLLNVVNALTGHLDSVGGAMFTRPALDSLYPPFGLGVSRGSHGRWRTGVRNLPETAGELPVAALAEEIDAGAIQGLLVWAGNPVLSTPDGRALDDALARLSLCVSVDFTLNETSRHAHYVLPAAPPLARSHYDAAFHLLAVRNAARYMAPVLPLDGEVRHDWRIALDIGRRLEARRGAGLRTRLMNRVLGIGPDRLLDLGLRLGPRGGWRGMSLRRLREAPHGIDLGALTPCLLDRMPPEHPRIQLAPAPLLADLDRLRARLDAPTPPLVLIGRRHLRSNNSWMHNSRRLVKGPERCTLLVHPEDAAAHGLTDGGRATVTSRVGTVEAPVEVSDEIMEGVVSLPHGWGHGRAGVRLSVASTRPGVSVNDLTDAQRVDPLTGNAALSGVPVRVAPAAPRSR